jgi:hypothetical protein
MRLALSNGPLAGMLIDFGPSQDFATSPSPGGKFSALQPGLIAPAASTDGGIDTSDADIPNWGAAEVMYVVNTSSSTFIPGNLVQVDKNYAIAAAATTANTGAPIYVCLSNFSAGNVTRQGGWVLLSGICPITTSVAATAGAVYLGTSKNVTPTLAAGKQVLNATCLVAASGAFTRAGTTRNGSSFVAIPRVNGLYPGLAFTGTGIPGASVISSIDPGGAGIVIGSAVGTAVNATASGTVTLTFTHTGYGVFQIQRPFVQGNIT